jgi:anti-anti-sigma regulatory factor
MPTAGGDRQRGGWYDVVSRVLKPGQKYHRFAWHDRKAWWQQEQGILAYMILAGTRKNPEYLKFARESAAFYNTWFLDHDSGGVYFNVLANGLPYLQGTERKKGSHSMSGYHSFELAYLAAVYSNLLLTKQPMDFYFKPAPGALADGILRVAPDLLPQGSIKIDSVTVDGAAYDKFDADGLTVTIPESKQPVAIKVRIVPTTGLDHFSVNLSMSGKTAKLTLSGDLDSRAVPAFRVTLNEAIANKPDKLVIDATGLATISEPGARALVFARQKMDMDEQIEVTGANTDVREILDDDEFAEEIVYK